MEYRALNGYVEGGLIRNSDHKFEGITSAALRHALELIQSPDYCYSRWTNYGVAIYHKDMTSPTGVVNKGGIPHELDFLITAFHKAGSLSPVEDLRTAH